MEMMVDGVSRAMNDRNLIPKRRIVDVYYSELMQNPQATVVAIYESFGVELPECMPAAIDRQITESPKGKHGTHSYSPETYGLSSGEIRERFSAYIERYDVPTEDS